MAARRARAILALEAPWDQHLNSRLSIGPILSVIEAAHSPGFAAVRRDVLTVPEVLRYLDIWRRQNNGGCPILVLAAHGAPGRLMLDGDRDDAVLDLDTIESHLEGCCDGRVIHFAACSVLDVHGARLNRFLRVTGALAVSGFRRDVRWIEATAFELAYLNMLTSYVLNPRGVRGVSRRIRFEMPDLSGNL